MDQPPVAPPPAAPVMGPASDNSKLIALLGYIFAPLGLIALALDPYKDEAWVRINVWQGAGLWLAITIIATALAFVGIGFLLWPLGWIYQVVLGIQAFQGGSPQVPVIYDAVKGLAKVD